MMNEIEKRKEQRRILRNLVLLSVAFLLNFTSFLGLCRLQSSLHIDQSMGTTNIAVLYSVLIVSCMFVPKFAIKTLRHKCCIALSIVGYILWMGANGIGRWWSMTPASVIVGLVAAPLWTAQCSYITLSAVRYAELLKERSQAVVTRFFGIFFFFMQLSFFFGSVISSTVLHQRGSNATESSEEVLKFCGRRDCPWNNITNENLEKPEMHVMWTMVGAYMGVACIAVIIVAVFMDNLPKELVTTKQVTNSKEDTRDSLLATVKQLRNIPQILLIPITMYSGFEQGYFTETWTKSFISCGLGIWMVGYATIPFGIVNAFVAFISGRLLKHVGRIAIFIAAALLDLCIQITLNIWMPNPSTPAVFYIISTLWGVTDGIWQTQINVVFIVCLVAVYGSIFTTESEAAFSNYRMWESLGFIIAFAYSSALCTLNKTIVLTCVLCVGMCGYLATEFYTRRSMSKSTPNQLLKD